MIRALSCGESRGSLSIIPPPLPPYLRGDCAVAVLVKELEGLFELGHLLLGQVLHAAAAVILLLGRMGDAFHSRLGQSFVAPTQQRHEQRHLLATAFAPRVS